MFEHSVKVPRHYKIASKIFKTVLTEGGSVKTLLYDDKLRHFRTNVLYALITETIKHSGDIDKIFEHCKVLENEPRFDPWLGKVLTAELLFGKRSLPGKSKPEQTILSYKEQFEKYASEHQGDFKTEDNPRPRYVRINTNLLTTSDAIRAFQDEGYKFIRCTSGSYGDYLEQIKKLTHEEFTQDYHVKTIFVFAPGTKWHDHELYLGNQIILQDKATALAVHLLAPPAGSAALDMCAAPGMKTTQLAAYLRNNGKVYAVEQNPQRYKTLCEFVERTESKCVQTFNRDSLNIKRGEFDDVEYILLDPSCSGSGMTMSVHNYVDENRLEKLTSLQEKFLKHAMNSFTKAKRIVYSTCSLYPEENERVIANVVKMSRAKWRVQNVKDMLKGQWNNMGSGMYGSIGARCLYAKPDSDMTTGFFLAVLDRDEKELAKIYEREAKEARNERKAAEKLKKVKEKDVDEGNAENESSDKIKKKKMKKVSEETVVDSNTQDTKTATEIVSKKKMNKETAIEEICEKTKKKRDLEVSVVENPDLQETGSVFEPKKKKKKDKDHHSSKRKFDTEDENGPTLTIIIDDLEELNVDQDLEAPKEKKKKKDEQNSLLDTTNSNMANVVETQSDNKELSKSKKNKKRKINEENSIVDNLEQEENVESSDFICKKLKKKKKKHHDVDN